MKKVFVAAISLLAFGAVEAVADAPIITTGKKGGSYEKVGYNLKGVIGGTVIPSKGSVENMQRIMDGEAQIAPVQMDAYAWYVNKHPGAESKLEVLGNLYEECVYIAVNAKGDIKSEDDLQSKRADGSSRTIAVGKEGSGTAVTWDYMRQLEPAYKSSAVSFSGGIRALGKLASQPKGNVNAVMWVARPIDGDKMVETVLNNKGLRFVAVNDRDLNDKYKPTGEPIYHFKTIDLAKGFLNDTEVKTICVDAAIIADADMDEEILEKVSDLILNYKETLLKK